MKKIIKFNKKVISFFLAVMMICSMGFTGYTSSAATTDANNGDWSSQNVTIATGSSEAQLMVRVGDIDNFGFGWPVDFKPFLGTDTPSHGYPFAPGQSDWDGTDRIMVTSGYKGYYFNGQLSTYQNTPSSKLPNEETTDGYAKGTRRDGYKYDYQNKDNNNYYYLYNSSNIKSKEKIAKANNDIRDITLSYANDLNNVSVLNATLQLFVDDFQAGRKQADGSKSTDFHISNVTYKATINGTEIPELSNLINQLNQSGPIGKLITFQIPQRYLDLVRTGSIRLRIDDTTTPNYCDGYAVDFVKLLINKKTFGNTATVTGKVTLEGATDYSGAKVSAGGVVEAYTLSDGTYTLSDVPAGLAVITASKSGYNSQSYTRTIIGGGTGYTQDFSLAKSTPPATPTITATPTTATSKVNATITYSSDSTIQQYRINIGGTAGEWKVYTGSFDVTQNCTIEAQGINKYGNESQIASYIVSNIATGVTISVTDSSNQSIPQYVNSGGKRSNTIFNNPITLASDATAKISYNFTNATMAKYDFVEASSMTTLPVFPNDLTKEIKLPAPNSYDAYSKDIGEQNYINTKHYVYQGKAGQALSRDVSFGAPIGTDVLVQKAISAKDIYETQGTGSNAFLLDMPNNVAYGSPNKNAATKAMKLWGYFCPERTGSYLLGAYSDDGAYGYIMVNGVKQVFVDDWRIAPPQFRATPAGMNSNTQVNTGNTYNGINLEGGKYYPIYMEWYEGQSNQAAFVPQYLYNQNSNYNFIIPSDINSGNSITNSINYAIPSKELYSSKTTTPGDIASAYFGDVSGIPFPNEGGIYYMATKFLNNGVETSGLYGPFIVTVPKINNLSVVSNNSSDNKKAVAGNTLTITFTASEALKSNPQIFINGHLSNATYTNISGNNYTATVHIGNDASINSSGDKITKGPITVRIANYSDLSGKEGIPVEDSSVIFNNLGITLELSQNTPDINGNAVVTAKATAYGDENSITTMKYASGNQPVNYFSSGGTDLTITSLTSSNNSDGILQSPVQSTFNVNTNGVYTVYAKDKWGNVAVQTIEVKPTPPVITEPINNAVINNKTPTIIGTAQANLNIKVYDGETLIGTVMSDRNGRWTLTPSTDLANGAHVIKATATDALGYVSLPSNLVNITIYEPSIILQHGIYSGSGAKIVTNTNVTDGIPVKLAMIVDAKSSNPVINLTTDSKITQGAITFKMYKISDSDNGTIDTTFLPKGVELYNTGNINLTGLTMESGHKYLIVYTVTPVGSGETTVTATADGDVTNSKSVHLSISPLPDLF